MDAAAGSDIDIEIAAIAVGVDINFPAIGTDCRMAVRGGTVQFYDWLRDCCGNAAFIRTLSMDG